MLLSSIHSVYSRGAMSIPTPHNYDSRKCLLMAKHALGVGLG